MVKYKSIIGNVNAFLLIIKERINNNEDYKQEVLDLLNYMNIYVKE